MDNIVLYIRDTYGHEMDMILKARKESVIPIPDEPKDDTSKSATYICHLEYKNYIIHREKFKQGLKRLLLLLTGQCNDLLKEKLRNRRKFKVIEDGRSVLNLIDDIEEEGYGLLRSKYTPVLYQMYCLKIYHHMQGKEFCGLMTDENIQ